MTQSLALSRVRPRRGFLAAVAELVRTTSAARPRRATSAAPFDRERHLVVPFALLNTGPR